MYIYIDPSQRIIKLEHGCSQMSSLYWMMSNGRFIQLARNIFHDMSFSKWVPRISHCEHKGIQLLAKMSSHMLSQFLSQRKY